MASEVDELLGAEEAVQQVLSELEALKAQVGHYSSAKQSLQTATDGLRSLIDKTSLLAEKAQNTIVELGKIGTPEILARISEAKQAVADSSSQVATEMQKLRSWILRFGVLALVSLLISVATLVRVMIH
jgi:hypothetical protein